MQQIGPKGLTRKHFDAVARAVPFAVKVKEYRWPLDVGERTINQVLDLAPWMTRCLVQSRLDAGERNLALLIQPPGTPRQKAKSKGGLSRVFKFECKERRVAQERAAYNRRERAKHKEL